MATTNTNRNLLISEEISHSSVKGLIDSILRFNHEDNEKENTIANYDRNKHPIILNVNSGGGSVYAGFALISAIEMSKTPVYTVGIGIIASMAVPIVLSGEKRFTHKHTTFMIHDMSSGAIGTVTEMSRKLEDAKVLKGKYESYILSKTSIRKAELEENDERVKDWFFDADEAVKLGVAHAVIESLDEIVGD